MQRHPQTCHCPICDEPDPHCKHDVNLAKADCAACAVIATERTTEMREALVAYYADRAAGHRSLMEDAELMGRTVQYLDADGVALEYAKKIGVAGITIADDVCGFCGEGGTDKVPHPVRWPGEESPGTRYVHATCEDTEARRAHAMLSDAERAAFLRRTP